MIATVAALVAAQVAATAPVAQRGPWLEMSGGPAFLRRAGFHGVSSGPLVRMDLGMAFAERIAAELWLSGALESAPLSTPGDAAVLGGGVGGRLRMRQLDEAGKLSLWGHAGVGFQAGAAGEARSGPSGFAGALLLFQPFVRRFALGIEIDGLLARGAFGVALLPSLRCAL